MVGVLRCPTRQPPARRWTARLSRWPTGGRRPHIKPHVRDSFGNPRPDGERDQQVLPLDSVQQQTATKKTSHSKNFEGMSTVYVYQKASTSTVHKDLLASTVAAASAGRCFQEQHCSCGAPFLARTVSFGCQYHPNRRQKREFALPNIYLCTAGEHCSRPPHVHVRCGIR